MYVGPVNRMNGVYPKPELLLIPNSSPLRGISVNVPILRMEHGRGQVTAIVPTVVSLTDKSTA